MSQIIYTIGHSAHPLDYFLELLQKHQINYLIDVRSVPASGRHPQYNKSNLRTFLQDNGIVYMHFGKAFGAQQDGKNLYTNEGQVDFEKVQRSEHFQNAIRLLKDGLEKNFIIALMCAEHDPSHCHRFSLLSGYLEHQGYLIQHILRDCSLLSNTQLENKLLHTYRKHLPQPNLFEPDITKSQQIKALYKYHNRRISKKRAK